MQQVVGIGQRLADASLAEVMAQVPVSRLPEHKLVSVDAEERDGGRIDVNLHNRTGEARAIQISLEVINNNGVKVDSTNFQDFALEARQERTFSMPGIHRAGHKIRVVLRQRSS